MEHNAVAFARIKRLGQSKGGDIFDIAARIPGRERDVLDDGVAAVGGVDFAEGPAAQHFISADGAEGLASECRCPGIDHDLRDLRVRRAAGDRRSGQQKCRPNLAHV